MASTTPNLSVLKQALFTLFEKFDENGDNLIDSDEFKKAMTHSGFVNQKEPNFEQRISQLFSKFDTDGSGTIKYTEFVEQGSKFTAFLDHLNIPFVDDTLSSITDDDTKTNISESQLDFKYTNKTSDLEQKVAELQSRIDEYKTNMLQYKDQRDTAEMKLKILQQKNEAMNEEIQQLKNDKSILETNVSELYKEISELRNDKIQLQSLSALNNNDNEFQKEIFELTNKLEKNRNDLIIYKIKNNEFALKIKSLTNKTNKLENIKKQLQHDNEQLILSTDEITMYCSELEISLENAETKINELSSESLYDNLKDKTVQFNVNRGARNRQGTIDMRGYQDYDELEHHEYDHVDLNDYDDPSDEPVLSRHSKNAQTFQPFMRSKRSSGKKRGITGSIDSIGYLALRNRAATSLANRGIGGGVPNEEMEEIKNMLINVKSDIKTMNIEVNENDDIINAINQSFASFKSDLLKNVKDDLREIIDVKLSENSAKDKDRMQRSWWEWW